MRKVVLWAVLFGLHITGWQLLSQPVFSIGSVEPGSLETGSISRGLDGEDALRVETTSEGSIHLHFSIGGDWFVAPVDIHENKYYEVNLRGAVSFGRPGAPDLPVYRKIVALPECDSVSVEVQVASTSTTSNIRVLPCARTREDPSKPGAGRAPNARTVTCRMVGFTLWLDGVSPDKAP